jgi:serine/threonine protein kinase
VLHQIGVGVLGPVFRAYQPDPGRLVAVKQFRLDCPPESAHRFVAALEQLIAADLTHLGIAAPIAAGLFENSPYLAMDFAAAESFDVVVRDYGPAPISEALRIATQLGGALDFAAAVDVFHGSLHPRDVLVSTDDTRVTGLGVARALEQVGLLPPIRRPYTAPERVAGLAWDRRADTFSLAALVYEMLFGRRIAGVGADAAEAIPSMDGIDVHAMRDLFARALAENPAERFDTALGFADALHNAAAAPASDVQPARSRRSRRKPPSETASAASSRQALPLEPDLPLAGPTEPLAFAAEPEASTIEPAGAIAPDGPGATVLPSEPEAKSEPLATSAPLTLDLAASSDTVTPLSLDADIEAIVARAERADAQPLSLEMDEDGLFDDIALAKAEADRYAAADDGLPPPTEVVVPAERAALDLDPEPVAVAPVHSWQSDPAAAVPSPAPTFSSAALEQGRSAIWPLALALIVGLLVGFAFGYGTGTRDRAGTAPRVTDAADTPPSSTAPQAEPSSSTPPAAASGSTPSLSAAPPSSPATGQPAASAAAMPQAPPQASAPQRSAPERTAPERTAPERGRMLVRSTPAGARVLVDGRDAGATPLTLNDVAFGTHVVRISREGYVAAERRVRIRAAQPAQSIEVELAAARPARGTAPAPAAPERTSGRPAAAPDAAGSLMVDSRPIGARVLVDGRMVGTTPLLLDAVSAGDHSVRLEMDGFNSWATTTRVVGGERNRVSGSLEQR